MTSTGRPPDEIRDFTAIARKLGVAFAARAEKIDESDEFVAGNYESMKSFGLIEAGVPIELGGGGADVPALCTMLRVLAQYCGSTALALAMHTHQVAIPAWRWRHQKATAVEPLLRRIANERLVLVTSGASDWILGSGKAERVDGGYRVTARKMFASGSPIGDLFMTSAVLDEEGQPMVLHFGMPMRSPNLQIVPVWKAMGMRGTGSNDVIIDGYVVPDAAIALMRRAGEWHPVFHVIAMIAFPIICSVYVGIAESARAIAIEMAKKRHADQHLIERIGHMETELRMAQLAHGAMMACAMRGEPGAATVNEIMMGRQLVGRHAIKATELAMEVAGGAGFYRAAGLERRFRDVQGARYHPMQEGRQREFAGRLALGLSVDQTF
jgi:alkylation response protein AidB-like acyl-CoA dehydrogenase